MSYGFTIDLEKCVGCHGCTVACKAANGTHPSVTRAKVIRTTEGTYPQSRRVIMPGLCMLCETPACVAVCPVEATYKREEDGIVVIDKQKCIGCRLCVGACPYGARYYIENGTGYFDDGLNEYEAAKYADVPDNGIVDKCDFCIEHNGGTPDPVCVKACMTEARYFGDLTEVEQAVAARDGFQYLPENGTDPQVYYLPNVPAKL